MIQHANTLNALRLVSAASLLLLGSACMSTKSAPAPANSKPGSASVSHGKSPVTKTTGSASM